MKVEKMIKIINEEIGNAAFLYRIEGKNNQCKIAKINGMIEMLEIASGKEYEFDENGLHEK